MNRKSKHPLLILGSILIIAVFLVACNGTSNQPPGANKDTNQENQVALPIVEINGPEEAYPAPEEKAAAESYPAPDETGPKPTPRGNSLVATDPATVNLASGQLQLVEMFAFW